MKITTPLSWLRLLVGRCVVALATVLTLSAALAAPAPAQSGRPLPLNSPDAIPDGLSATDWSSIRQQFEQHRHAAVPVDDGYQARNPGQQWQTRFDGRAFIIRPDAGGWQWDWNFAATASPAMNAPLAASRM